MHGTKFFYGGFAPPDMFCEMAFYAIAILPKKHMRSFFFALAILSLSSIATHAQSDSVDVESGISFKNYYKCNNPTIKYTFNRYSYIHDYSGNWDFDGDGKPDILLFIPNGGAHVY